MTTLPRCAMVYVGVAPDAAAAQGVTVFVPPPPELSRVTTHDPFDGIPFSFGPSPGMPGLPPPPDLNRIKTYDLFEDHSQTSGPLPGMSEPKAFAAQQEQVPWSAPSPYDMNVWWYVIAEGALGLGEPLPASVPEYQASWQASEPLRMGAKSVIVGDEAWIQTDADIQRQAAEICQRWMGAKSVDLGDEAWIQTNADIQRQAPGGCASTTGSDGTGRSTLRRRRRIRAIKRGAAGSDGVCRRSIEECDAKVTQDPRSARELADELLEQLKAGGEAQRAAAACFRHMAFSSKALSYVAQQVLEETSEKAVLAAAMHGQVRAAMHSMYANYVLQKLVELMPVQSISFVAQELLGAGREFARQQIGCRALCRLLEHGNLSGDKEPFTARLLEEILADAAALNIHIYGNYVTRHIMEFGLPEHRRRVVAAILTDTWATARQQYGCRVVEAALQHAEADGKQAIATELLARPRQLAMLAKEPYGVHVTRALMKTSTLGAETRRQAKACLSRTSTGMTHQASNTATA